MRLGRSGIDVEEVGIEVGEVSSIDVEEVEIGRASCRERVSPYV